VHCRKRRYTQRKIGVEDKEAGKYPMQQNKPRPTAIFSVYAPSDTIWLERWEAHLHPLEQSGTLSVWSARHLQAGTDRLKLLHNHLDQADLIVLLLSADFFTDDECIALMERALMRHQQGTARLIPLLLRPVAFRETKLAPFIPLPSDGRPVTLWEDSEAAFDDCVRELRRILGRPVTVPLMGKPQRTEALQNQNRERMLRRLRRSYTEMMSQSLQGAVWLELGLSDRPDAVQNAANLLLRVESRAERPLAPFTSITEVYDEAEHELLILGEPGTGKSTLLLDLAEHLVERAEKDQIHPLPVILPLSTWASKRPKLEDWMAEQISEIYDVPRKVSTEWVAEGRILPLLDGLDEMDEAARPACIAAMNAYHRDHLAKLVVCSRTTEYEAVASHSRLALQGAVMVQPLTHEHVDAYLIQAGKPLTALRRALKKNMALHTLSTTPLMLNILMLTYQGVSVRDLPHKEATLLQQVWNDYVQRMVMRKGKSKRYPLGETQAWLGYLARQMRFHNQTVFYLEHLQPDWLKAFQQHTYVELAVRLPAIVIGVLISTLVFLFFTGSTDLSSLLHYGVLGGLLGGVFRGPRDLGGREPRHTSRKQLVKRIAVSICIGLIYGLSFGFSLGHYYSFDQLLIEGLSSGVIIGGGCLLLQYQLASPFRSSLQNTALGGWKRMLRFWCAVQGLRALLVAIVNGLSAGLGFGVDAIPNFVEWRGSRRR
jgi:DNA polymerase III delta prime subunit